jgi:vanillin dehydrogenase
VVADGPGERRAILSRAAELITERQNEIAGTMIEETGATFGWGMFNCMLATGMLREAAAQTYGSLGEVIPSDVPGKLAMAVRAAGRRGRRHRAVERARDPRRARDRDAAGVRQHGRAEGLRAVPAHARPRRRGDRRRRRCRRASINFLTNQPEDAADVVEELIAHPTDAPRQLHRLDPRRADHRREGRRATSSACCSNSAARRR